MRFLVDAGAFKGWRRYVASTISKGRTTSTLWAMKNGE